jgi:hypothetical protein
MAKHHESVHDGRAVHEDEYGHGKDASEQGEVGEKWADRLHDQSVSSPLTIPAHGVAPSPHEPAAQAEGGVSVRSPTAGSFAPSASSFGHLDAFLAKSASPLTAQLLATGQLKPATLSHGAPKVSPEPQPPEPAAEPKQSALTRNDKDAENSPCGSGFNGASASGSSTSVCDVCPASVSLNSHGTQRVMPSVSKVTKDGDAKSKSPELKGVAAAPAPAAKSTQKSPEAHKDLKEHPCTAIGPLRGTFGPGADSPRSSPKWPMSGNDSSKQAKMKSEGKAEIKSSQAVPKLEREQLQRPTHDGASHLRDKGEMAGKLDGQNSSKASAQGVAATTGEKGRKKASREGKQKTSKGNANAAAIKDQDSILVCE